MIYLIVELKLQGEGERFRGNTKKPSKSWKFGIHFECHQ